MSKLILIVDSDKKTQMILQRLFFEEGYRTIVADDGWEGAKVAKISKPDLIVMDLIMRDFNGLVTCYILKKDKATKKIPLVIFTDMDGEVSRNVAKNLGADRYIIKHFGRDKLLEAISQLLPTS